MERLQEIASIGAARVDRAAGLIRGVKILGPESRNGRTYSAEALRRAASLYEGKAVNVDHVEPDQRRSYADRIGKLSNVRATEGGLFGDLQVNPKHPLGEQVLWDAEHSPASVGLSHDATGRTSRRDGRVIVEEITSVRSVDLVAEPASTSGLFESTDPNAAAAKPQRDRSWLPAGFGESIDNESEPEQRVRRWAE